MISICDKLGDRMYDNCEFNSQAWSWYNTELAGESEMTELSKSFIDKSSWGLGEWLNEPDKIQWVGSDSDYDCLIVRSKISGSLCGYVGIPKNHPCFEKYYDWVVLLLICRNSQKRSKITFLS